MASSKQLVNTVIKLKKMYAELRRKRERTAHCWKQIVRLLCLRFMVGSREAHYRQYLLSRFRHRRIMQLMCED